MPGCRELHQIDAMIIVTDDGARATSGASVSMSRAVVISVREG